MTGRRSFWDVFIPALLGAFGWVLVLAVRSPLPPMPVLFAALAGALFLTVAVHEAGHAVAGILAGCRCALISIWFLQVCRSGSGWTLRRARGLRLLGYALLYPRPGGDSRRRMLAMTAGGPLASLLAGTAAALWAWRIERASSQWLFWLVFLFSVLSLAAGLVGLLPLRGKHFPSDGLRIRMLLRSGPQAERWSNLALLAGASMEGTRPRDLDPELIRQVTTIQDESPDAFAATAFAYNWAVDSGRLDEAAGLLRRTLEERQRRPEPARAVWLCEAAWFEAVFRQDLCGAKHWMEHPENRESRFSAGARWKAQAAIAALEGRFDEAESAARNALKELEHSPDQGVVKAIRETLARITARPPQNARPTVLP